MDYNQNLRGEELKASIKEYIEYDDSIYVNLSSFESVKLDKNEILRLINECTIFFNQTTMFGNKNCFFREYIEIKIPIHLKKALEVYKEYLNKICKIYYEPVGDYEFWGINILPQKKSLVNRTNEVKLKTEKKVIEAKDVIYDNFKIQVINNNYDEIEKSYIIEACECGINGYKLATATMIGCAAERLLILLCEAYSKNLEKNGSEREVLKFNEEILNAKKAHKRLEGFLKVISNKKHFFEELGFENHELNLSFLDIIRQIRNDAGHPTGIIIEADKLQTIITNYSLLYDKIHMLIDNLVL